MKVAVFILITLITYALMEVVTWLVHKYVMHGFLWVLHKDHHIRDGRKFELNDWFAVMFALPSIYFIIKGSLAGNDYRFYIGLGISLYGLAYFLFHDVYVHQRLKLFKNFTNRYLRATVRAHEEHHKKGTERNFGFLIAPFNYYKEEFSKTA